MSELLKITYEKEPYGFGKRKQVKTDGAKFDNGKIAYLDERGEIRVFDSPWELKDALKATIEVL